MLIVDLEDEYQRHNMISPLVFDTVLCLQNYLSPWGQLSWAGMEYWEKYYLLINIFTISSLTINLQVFNSYSGTGSGQRGSQTCRRTVIEPYNKFCNQSTKSKQPTIWQTLASSQHRYLVFSISLNMLGKCLNPIMYLQKIVLDISKSLPCHDTADYLEQIASETSVFELLQSSSSQILRSTELVNVFKSQSDRYVRIEKHRGVDKIKCGEKILSNTLLTFPEGDSKIFPHTLFCPPLKMAFRQVPLGCLSLWTPKLLFSGGQLLQDPS